MTFRIGLAQCGHPADGDVIAKVDAFMRRAHDAGVDLLVFPESLMTPYEMDAEAFAKAAEPLDGPFCTSVNALAAEHGIWTVYTANELGAGDNRPFNTAVVVDDSGTVQGCYRKTHLFDTDFTQESAKISAGDSLCQPIRAPFATIGIGICYDLRFPELARTAAIEGCDLVVYPSAWVDGPRKVAQWKTLLAARAIENEIFVAGACRPDRGFGSQKRDYAGNSCVFGPLGDELAFADLGDALVTADIDIGEIANARAAMPILDHRRPELYGMLF